jgi:hypothetical protein
MQIKKEMTLMLITIDHSPMQHKVMGRLENYRHTTLEDIFTWQPVCPCSYV